MSSPSLLERIDDMKCRTLRWLNGRSASFSKLCEFDIRRITVVRLHAVLCLALLTAGLAEHHTLLAIVCAATAAYIGKDIKEKGGEA